MDDSKLIAMPKVYLDEYFPVHEINRLAKPERSAYKPIYQMQKWFARRSSSVFRALLLAACLPAKPPEEYRQLARSELKAQNGGREPDEGEIKEFARLAFLMAEFYRNHQHDPRTKDKIVLDPFMGGGTTLVEAARLGMKPIGIDLNPVAWFITHTELAAIDVNAFLPAYRRLEARVAADIKKWYGTACPNCGGQAEIIYALWVKHAACTTCDQPVRLFSRYVITTKQLRIPYIKDVVCPACSDPAQGDYKLFDWELEKVSYVHRGEDHQLRASDGSDAGENRPRTQNRPTRYAYAAWGSPVRCPHCGQEVRPRERCEFQSRSRTGRGESRAGLSLRLQLQPVMLADGSPWCFGKTQVRDRRKNRWEITGRVRDKRVSLSVLCSPFDGEVFEFRGKLPDVIGWRGRQFRPKQGPQRKGRYTCAPPDNDCRPGDQRAAGHANKLIDFLKRRPGHPVETDLLGRPLRDPLPLELFAIQGYCSKCAASAAGLDMKATNYKFYKRPDQADLALLRTVEAEWERCKETTLAGCWPKDPIPYGMNTYLNNGSIPIHGYAHWIKLFNCRQRLCLATIVAGIKAEPDRSLRAALAAGLINLLSNYNTFTMWNWAAEKVEGIFFNHAFVPKAQPCELNPWATPFGRGSYPKVVAQMLRGFAFRSAPFDCAQVPASNKAGSTNGKHPHRNPFVEDRYQNGQAFAVLSHSQASRFKRRCLEIGGGWHAFADLRHGHLSSRPNGPRKHGTHSGGFAGGVPYLFQGHSFVWDGFDHLRLHSINVPADYERFLNLDRAAATLWADSSDLRYIKDQSVDLVVTDPPFGGNVNYSELADFFYVWLALILKRLYRGPAGEDIFNHRESLLLPYPPTEAGIKPDEDGYCETRSRPILQTPKAQEVVANPTQGKTAAHYSRRLRSVFQQCRAKLKPDGLLVFTFHHAELAAWWAMLNALLDTGFYLEATYPIVGESAAVAYQLKPLSVSMDIIHVCRQRSARAVAPVTWDELKEEILRAVRWHRAGLERNLGLGGRLPLLDVRMLLLGKGMELYSKHYGRVNFPKDFLGTNLPPTAPPSTHGAASQELWAVLHAIHALIDDLTAP